MNDLQYGFHPPAKCDIGVGRVRSRLAVLSLDPETKGAILEFINIRDDVSIISLDFSPSNNFFLLATEDKWKQRRWIMSSYLRYRDNVGEQHATVRIIQSATWEVVVWQVCTLLRSLSTILWTPLQIWQVGALLFFHFPAVFVMAILWTITEYLLQCLLNIDWMNEIEFSRLFSWNDFIILEMKGMMCLQWCNLQLPYFGPYPSHYRTPHRTQASP